MIELPADSIAIGHCVILNDFEKPCGRLVCVITEMLGNVAYCKYLCKDRAFDSHNAHLGMRIELSSDIHNITPVAKFGVRVCYESGSYICEQITESKAIYRDGRPRYWQETHSIIRDARNGVVKFCLGVLT